MVAVLTSNTRDKHMGVFEYSHERGISVNLFFVHHPQVGWFQDPLRSSNEGLQPAVNSDDLFLLLRTPLFPSLFSPSFGSSSINSDTSYSPPLSFSFSEPSFFLFQISYSLSTCRFIHWSIHVPPQYIFFFLTPLTRLALSVFKTKSLSLSLSLQNRFLFLYTIFRSSSSLDKHMRMYGKEYRRRIRVIIIIII